MAVDYHLLPSVPTVEAGPNDNLFELVEAYAEPVVIKGAVKGWPVVQAGLTSAEELLGYLRSFSCQKQVHLMSLPKDKNARYFYNQDLSGMNFKRQMHSFDAVLEMLLLQVTKSQSSEYLYMGSTQVDAVLPNYRQYNDLNGCLPSAWASVWLGNQSRIATHYDVPDNLACNLAGERRFTLFPPEQIKNLYPGPIDYTPAGQVTSMVDFANPDVERYPRFKDALKTAMVAELSAGDVVYIPSMWWHHVEGLSSVNLLQNYWWRPVPAYAGNPTDALLHALLSIKDLPSEQKQHWKALFEYYIFSDIDLTHLPIDRQGVLNCLTEDSARKLRGLLLNKLNR
ncbi:cupin-like domain-containing protein [Gayadomonas joobiniege]|uniref:cupin-like domain-containing protein n=1 Tax=Gayadomonas joobiniege TaxID=1234606 RepID=UPI000365D19A|nr:cupin-like domain-containing protein [Gayadomonas joobiniege]